MSAENPLLRRYQLAVEAGELAEDPAQSAVARQLGQLAGCLVDQPRKGALRRWLGAHWPGSVATSSCRGIYLWGGVGRGKTWLMDLLRAELPPKSARRLHFQHLMREVHERLRRSDRRARPLEQVAAQLASRARVLCIDELLVQDIGDAMILHGLFAGLLHRGVTLVITSNTPPARLYEGGLQRERFLPAIELLQAQLDVIEIGPGPDYRLQQLGRGTTYLPSAAPDTTQRMEELFQRLAGPAAERPARSIRLEGRRVEVRRLGNGMAWFDFAALCEGPRAANDYIALARMMPTVFLSDVPVFDEHRDDAARRFIALIDEFYDRGVQLVISAAAEPGELYRGERLRGAFARTASRLMEMRSRSYLARAQHSRARQDEMPERDL